jgi:hypothetical protein
MTKKDPAKVAAAYKGLMPKTVTSPKWKLIPEDYQKFMRDMLIFSIPAGIVFLTVLQQGGTVEEAGIAIYTWALSQAINLLQKWAGEKTYIA